MDNNKKAFHSALLVLTAFIWGIAFVAQSEGGKAIGAYSFSCVRYLIGAVVLLPVIKFLDSLGLTKRRPVTKQEKQTLFIAGICCGVCLCFASIFQQLGLYLGTSSGKAGFLTACYIVFVPILGLFIKKRCHWNIWFSVVITLIGLYLLCVQEGFSIHTSDLMVLVCSFLFALHILTIDHFMDQVDVVRMSCIQFFVAGLLACIPMFWFDMQHSFDGIKLWFSPFTSWNAWIPLLYAGVLSSGVGYTLQTIGQQDVHPAIASLLLSLESVFSVLAGWMILGERLTIRELFGCILIFIAVIIAQLPTKKPCD